MHGFGTKPLSRPVAGSHAGEYAQNPEVALVILLCTLEPLVGARCDQDTSPRSSTLEEPSEIFVDDFRTFFFEVASGQPRAGAVNDFQSAQPPQSELDRRRE